MKNEEKKGDSSHPHRLKLIHSCFAKLYDGMTPLITSNLITNARLKQGKKMLNPNRALSCVPITFLGFFGRRC